VRDLAVHLSTLRRAGTSSPSQSFDIEFNLQREKGLLKGRRKSCSFLKDLLADGLGHPGWEKNRERERERERGNEEGTNTRRSLLIHSSSSSSSFVFDIIRKLIGRVVLRC
jgi:hypothetical protein